MTFKSMRDLLLQELKDVFSAEQQIEKALPKAIEKVSSPELKEALTDHLEETREQIRRIEQIAGALEEDLKGEHCPAMEGLLEEVTERIEEGTRGAVLDAAIISACQRVEHYEIAAYGSARAFAEIEGEDEVEELLAETLEEEKAADEKLNDIALSLVNEEAEMEGDEDVEPKSPRTGRASGQGKGRAQGARSQGKRSEGGREHTGKNF